MEKPSKGAFSASAFFISVSGGVASMSALDSTHTVVVKAENRGIRVVIGAAVLLIWFRWWWTGRLLFAAASAVPAFGGPDIADGEFGSTITGTLLPIAVDCLWFVGSVVIFLMTKGWAVLWDLFIGIFETFAHYAARRDAIEAAKQAATEAGTGAAETNAGSVAATAAVDSATQAAASTGEGETVTEPEREFDLAKVGEAVLEHDAKLAAVDGALYGLNARINAQATRLESLEREARVTSDRLNKLEAKDRDAMHAAVMESLNGVIVPLEKRVVALEAPKPPARRKVTRQSAK